MVKRIIITTSLCFILGLAGYQLNSLLSIENTKTHTSHSIKHEPQDIASPNRWNAEILEVIEKLTSQYGDTIHLIHVQAMIIYIREPLVNELMPPADIKLKAILAAAFPNYEDSILSVWQRMDHYEEWLLTQNRTLMELNALSRSGMLWEKRKELFPIAAEKIWHEQQDNYETAQINLHSEIDELDVSFDLAMSERIQRLETSFEQANNLFTSSIGEQTSIHKNTIASVLFGMTSVQAELQQRDPENRQLEIDSIRRELGFSEDTISKMSVLDAKREARWNTGYAYMDSRNQLLADNDQLPEDELNELRDQFFGNSAATIAREESRGFYRFQRPRYYGRN